MTSRSWGLLDQRGRRVAIRQSEAASHVLTADTALGISPMPFVGLVFAELVRRRRAAVVLNARYRSILDEDKAPLPQSLSP